MARAGAQQRRRGAGIVPVTASLVARLLPRAGPAAVPTPNTREAMANPQQTQRGQTKPQEENRTDEQQFIGPWQWQKGRETTRRDETY